MEQSIAKMNSPGEYYPGCVTMGRTLESSSPSSEVGVAGQESALALDLSTAAEVLRGHGLLPSNPAYPLVIDLLETALPPVKVAREELRKGEDG